MSNFCGCEAFLLHELSKWPASYHNITNTGCGDWRLNNILNVSPAVSMLACGDRLGRGPEGGRGCNTRNSVNLVPHAYNNLQRDHSERQT